MSATETMAACFGATDQAGAPLCEGEDVREVTVRDDATGEVFHTQWCEACRYLATHEGVGGAAATGGCTILRVEPPEVPDA